MDIECPECETSNDVEGDDLPDCACDSSSFECRHCGAKFKIGWYATVEVR